MHDENQTTDQLNSLGLLRDYLLPNLLKEDEEDILYWAGKELARSFTIETIDELAERMRSLFAGTLEETKKTKHTVTYSFSGPFVHHRLTSKTAPHFSLEAGFLAEAYQRLTGNYTESTYDIQNKQSQVTFLLQSDHHVSLDEN